VKLAELQAQREAEEYAKAKEYPIPEIGITHDEYGTLIWYQDFESEPYDDASYAKKALKFTAGAVMGSIEIVDSPSGKGKALKVTPNASHSGYRINFPQALKDKGTYTFIADYYLPEGSKIDAWFRWEITTGGVKKDPSSWKAGKFIKDVNTWGSYTDVMVVDDTTTAIHDFSARKEKVEVYYLDNVRVYYKAE
jgi:hypothetical protein